MEAKGTATISSHRAWWRWLITATVAMMLLSLAGAPSTIAETDEDQETPDVVIPGTGDENDNEATPAAESDDEEDTADQSEEDEQPASQPSIPDLSATEPGFPAVIAQGLAFLTGDRVVWQVREVQPDDAGSATAETSNAAIVYQVDGTTIIRNDVTGKRAQLEPGEAFFKSGGDAYTTVAGSDESTIWIFEVVGDTEVAEDAFYESPLIEDYDESVLDLEMIRYVLEPGQSADLPDHSGPALVMSTQGDIDVESGGLGLLATGDGQLVTEPGVVSNNSDETVVYVVVAFGSEVADDSVGEPAAPTPEADAGETADTGEEEVTNDTATTDEETTTEEESTDSGETSDGSQGSTEYQASINITALEELYVVVVVDGVTVFDGPIPAGGQSGVIVGSAFEVYTTNGAATQFTDACGNDFFMGYDAVETTFYLEANADSCPP